MVTSLIAGFITEVAPPQYVTVMRSRAFNMLATINEEDRDVGTYGNDSRASSPKSPSSLSPSFSASASTPTITSIVDAAAGASHSKYFFKNVQNFLLSSLKAKRPACELRIPTQEIE